jgi:hypothetical protein
MLCAVLTASAASAQFTIVEPPSPNGQLVPTSVSTDGRVVVGYHRQIGVPGSETFVYADGQLTIFPELPFAQRVSADGTFIAGSAGAELWRYERSTGIVEMVLPTVQSGALLLGGLSSTGETLGVIQIATRQTLFGNAYLWNAAAGFTPAFCPQYANLTMSNVLVADDGVTTAVEAIGGAFHRRSDGTCVTLPLPPWITGGITLRAISGDGSTVVGQAGGFATRWRNGTAERLPFPALGNPAFSQLVAVSGNGSLTSGYAGITRTGENEWLYSDEMGLLTLPELLSSWGINIPQGATLLYAISGDGKTLVGSTYAGAVPNSPASFWIAREPACSDIDFNNDGLFPDDQDLLDYLFVLAGGACSTDPPVGQGCDGLDFNNDTITPSDEDLIAFLVVLAGGTCE